MKRYGSKLLTAIFAITVLLTFSSCDKDEYEYKYEWKRGTLDLSTEYDEYPVWTDNRGYFNFSYDLRAENNIGGIDIRRFDIVEVVSQSSEIFLFYGELFRHGDRINIRLDADGVTPCTLRMEVHDNREATVIDADYYLLERFMTDMVYNLARRGQLNFYIEGQLLDVRQETYFDFEVINNFDFKVRY